MEKKLLAYANKLEGILVNYLGCHYSEFGVKANNDLLIYDWKSPVNFALGCKYGESERNEKIKEEIESFLGNEFYGKSIEDIISNFEYLGFENENVAEEYIDKTIEKINNLLKM